MRYLLFVITALAMVSCKGSFSRVARPQLGTHRHPQFLQRRGARPGYRRGGFRRDREGRVPDEPPQAGQSDVSRVNRGPQARGGEPGDSSPWCAAPRHFRRNRRAFDITFAALFPSGFLGERAFHSTRLGAVAFPGRLPERGS